MKRHSFIERSLENIIQSFLPMDCRLEEAEEGEGGKVDQGVEPVWQRIETLDNENKRVVEVMMDLTEDFKASIAAPRDIYLRVQQVRSLTVYVRWRRKGVRGRQAYLTLNSIEGKTFLVGQTTERQVLYRRYNHWALALNLAHSLRLNEIRRLRLYIHQRHF